MNNFWFCLFVAFFCFLGTSHLTVVVGSFSLFFLLLLGPGWLVLLLTVIPFIHSRSLILDCDSEVRFRPVNSVQLATTSTGTGTWYF